MQTSASTTTRHQKQERRERDSGESAKRSKEIAARTINKERAQAGQTKTASRSSVQDMSPSERGGKRSGKPGPRGRTRDQLYNEARQRGIEGRSSMNKEQLRRAVDARKK